MNREEAIEKWVVPALKNTWNEKRCNEVLDALKQELCEKPAEKQEPCDDEYIKVPKKALKYVTKGMVAYNHEWLKNHFDIERAVICGEQEPCDDVCEWFEQYVDIATDIVELRFSDGTVKRVKRGLYMRDIEKSIRKMLIDQIANEKKQEPKWIPVSERLPEEWESVLVCLKTKGGMAQAVSERFEGDRWTALCGMKPIAWMPLPEPYKAESEVEE